jgi:hypothetical protein
VLAHSLSTLTSVGRLSPGIRGRATRRSRPRNRCPCFAWDSAICEGEVGSQFQVRRTARGRMKIVRSGFGEITIEMPGHVPSQVHGTIANISQGAIHVRVPEFLNAKSVRV